MKSLLIVNQYFPPDQAATAQLLGQLAEGLSEDFNVTVICGTPTYAPDTTHAPAASARIHRVPLIPGPRKFLPLRILNYLFFLWGAWLLAIVQPKPDVVMCWTDPPLVGLIGAFIRWTKGSRFLFVSQDVYPEVARAAQKMNDPVSLKLLSLTSRIILRNADNIVALGEDMKEVLLGKGCDVNRVTVIPNWQDLTSLTPQPKNAFRSEMAIPENMFVVMHSGNLGLSQDFDTFLSAAEALKNENILFVIVGDGALEKNLRQKVLSMKLMNVRMFRYQPAAKLAKTLSAADLHYVSLKKDFLGLIVPSKLYGIMAVGRPVIANVPHGCEVERVVKSAQCGFISSSNPNELAQTIVKAQKDRELLEAMGQRGRSWIEQNGGKEPAVKAYRGVMYRLDSKKI